MNALILAYETDDGRPNEVAVPLAVTLLEAREVLEGATGHRPGTFCYSYEDDLPAYQFGAWHRVQRCLGMEGAR